MWHAYAQYTIWLLQYKFICWDSSACRAGTNATFTSIERNTRRFTVRRCFGNESIVTDEDTGQFDLMDGLQANELQQVYVWNIRELPGDPFVLYNFVDPVRATTVVRTFMLLQTKWFPQSQCLCPITVPITLDVNSLWNMMQIEYLVQDCFEHK